MKVGFLIYKWKFVNPKTDSALRLIRQLIDSGVDVYIIYEHHLNYENSLCKGLRVNSKNYDDHYSFHANVYLQEENLDLEELKFIIYSNVPPLGNKMLRFLDELENPKIFNNVKGLDKVRFKNYVQELLPENSTLLPLTHYAKHSDEIIQFIEAHREHHKWILKPNVGYGGDNIMLLQTKKDYWQHDLKKYVSNSKGTIVLQEFLPGVSNGDTRILMLQGKPLGAMKRIPGEIHYLTNCHSGGRAIPHEITDAELDICNQIGNQLKKDGLVFAGIDIIQDKLIEVNGLSPGGIGRINYLSNTALEIPIIEKILNIA